jgi:hypothetical protein
MKYALLAALICGQALAADVTVKVTPPTQYADGSALPITSVCAVGIFGAATKADASDRKYLGQTLVGVPAYTDKAVPVGTYFYFATAIADSGESDISNGVQITIAKSKALPPVISVSVSAP